MNNLLALAPAGSAAALGLCRAVALGLRSADAAQTAAAPRAAGTPLTARHQV